jgi:hypothetical protein
MLVAHLFRDNANVGVSIGKLYWSNTMGAALGALAAGVLLFRHLTLDQSIYLAATGNFIVCSVVYLARPKEAA